MTLKQTNLSNPFTNEKDDSDSESNEKETTKSVREQLMAPPEKRGGDGCCPWCLGTKEDFEKEKDGVVGCPHCGSAIPTKAKWYLDGEKIII